MHTLGILAYCEARDGVMSPELVAEFEDAVLRSRPMLVSVARRILNDSDAAEEAVQRALLNAWRMLGEFRGEARISSWLYGIVVNNCAIVKNHHQVVRKKRADVKKHYELRVESPGPEAACFKEEIRRLVRLEVRRSPRLFRRILEVDLALFQAEEADLIGKLAMRRGISRGAAQSRRTRARRWLRDRMKRYVDARAI